MRIRIFIWCSSGCGFGYLFDVVPDTDPDFYLCWCKFECGFKLPKQCGSGSTTRLLLENFFIIWKLMLIVSGSSLLLWHSSGYRSVFFILCGYESGCRSKIQNNADPSRSGCGFELPKQCGSIRIRIHNTTSLGELLSSENLCRSGPGSNLSVWYSSRYRSEFLFYTNANPDADPSSKKMLIHPDPDADTFGSGCWSTTRLFLRMRIRIHNTTSLGELFIIWKLMRIRSRIQLITFI